MIKKTNRLQENKTVTKILIMLGILKYIDDPYESPSQHLLVQAIETLENGAKYVRS